LSPLRTAFSFRVRPETAWRETLSVFLPPLDRISTFFTMFFFLSHERPLLSPLVDLSNGLLQVSSFKFPSIRRSKLVRAFHMEMETCLLCEVYSVGFFCLLLLHPGPTPQPMISPLIIHKGFIRAFICLRALFSLFYARDLLLPTSFLGIAVSTMLNSWVLRFFCLESEVVFFQLYNATGFLLLPIFFPL